MPVQIRALPRSSVVRSETRNGPVYLRLAGVLEEMITHQSLRPGDRMPSVRQFSRQQRVSVPTALQAYATLETRGIIEARPKSGFYVRHRLASAVPEPNGAAGHGRVTSLSGADPFESILADLADPELVPLGAAMPDARLLPGEKLARTMAMISRKLGPASGAYDMVPGSVQFRRELARSSLEWGCALRPEDFIVTVGATEAVSLALRATCQPGDTVVVESPTYFGFARMLHELGLRALPVPVHSAEGIDLDAFERALQRNRVAACLLIPNFHNPVGCLMPDENKRRLIELISKHRIPVVEDDIYGDMQHHGPRPRCLKAFDREGLVLLCGSYSKSLAPGYRVGYIAGGHWQQRVAALKRVSTLCTATLPVLAIADFLRNGGYDRYLRSIRETFRQQVDRMREAIVDAFPPGIRLSRPQGGFLLWCELPARVDAERLAREARAAGISVAPGSLFSADGGFGNFIRINCGHPWTARIERAVGVLGDLARTQCG